ncbi:hypothetical protein BH23PAT2_BH23PAT2_07180 [soil metagenome]
MKRLLNITRVLFSVLVKTVLLSALLVSLAILAQKAFSYLSPLFDDYLTGFWWILGVTIVAFVALHSNRIIRSTRTSFTKTHALIISLTVLTIYWIAATGGSFLYKDYQKYSTASGWMGTILLVILMTTLLAKVRKKKEKSAISNITVDDPKNTKTQLTESQQIVYDRLSLLINSTVDTSIALTGGWGTGKTKIIHHLKTYDKNNLVWFEFYPWAYHSEESLTKDFYFQLLKTIDQNLPRLPFSDKSALMSAIKRLTDGKVVNGIASFLVGLVVDVSGTDPEPDEIIAGRLRDEKLPIVIVVDDLDRVKDMAIINRTLQLVHHLRRRNIYGVKLITAFEKDSVIEALPKHAKKSGDTFIEKFFDVEVILPDPRPTDLWDQLVLALPEAVRPSYFNKVLLQDLGTHRAIIRLVNEYHLSGEVGTNGIDLNQIVNMDDFMVLAHIKLKYSQIYKDISVNRGLYTQYLDGDGEATLEWHFADPKQQEQIRHEHIDNLCNKQNLDDETALLVKNMLANTFPEIASAVKNSSSKNMDYDLMRKERRLGLRMVLDAAFGLFDSLSEISKHEYEARKVVKIIESTYADIDVQLACDKLVDYCVSISGDGWDMALRILTNELSSRDELCDAAPIITKSLIRSAVKLDCNHDNGLKTRIFGQAFYILVNLLFYRGKTEQEKKELVKNLDLSGLIKDSATPFGSLLLVRLDLSREAGAVKKQLSDSVLNELRLTTRKQFENYYITEQHDPVDETPEILNYLDEGWLYVAGNYKKGLSEHAKWKLTLQNNHPSFFLDKYTTKTYRGNWSFKEDDFGTIRPVKDISQQQLDIILGLVSAIKDSPNLSDEDKQRIHMINEYANR